MKKSRSISLLNGGSRGRELTGRKSRAHPALFLAIVSLLAGCRLVSHGQNSSGVALYQQGLYQGAIQRFQQAVATDPRNPDGYYNLASTFHRLGKLNNRKEDLDQAENYYNQCLDHDPDHRDCYRALAVLLAEQNRREEAVRLLEGWSTRSPSLADPKIELARLRQELGNRTAAKEQLLEALTVDPYNPRALAALGKLHEEVGDTSQALADYQRSLWHDRFQPEVAARIASLRAAIGPAPVVTPPGGTRTVQGPTRTPRY